MHGFIYDRMITMIYLKNLIKRNKKDILLFIVISLFITLMHGINQTRIHRESADLYWKYLQPTLIQRYISLANKPEHTEKIPELLDATHQLIYSDHNQAKQWVLKVEQKIKKHIISQDIPEQSPILQTELSRYNQTADYIQKKETEWLYVFAKKLVNRSNVKQIVLTK